jgi:DNA-binding FadR family transcriptional regulator
VKGTAQHSLDDHRKILEFIENGHYDQGKEEMKKHLRFTVDLVKNQIFYSTKACVG